MGCCPSKNETKSVGVKREYQKRVLRRTTDGYEELLITKDGGERLFARLCNSNSVTKKLVEHESFKQSPIDKNRTPEAQFHSTITQKAVGEQEESEKIIETINTWELLAGLEDENEAGEQSKEEMSFSSWNAAAHSSGTCKDRNAQEETKLMETKQGGEMEKSSRRKVMAKEIAAPSFELSRTGSLRDWLPPGGQVFSPGSYKTPRFGSRAPAAADGAREGCHKDLFDPKLVAQLEQAMEDLTTEEEEVLRLIL